MKSGGGVPREQTEEECPKGNCKHPHSYINPLLPKQKEKAWLIWGNKHKGPTPHHLALRTACFGSLQLCGGQPPYSCIDQLLAQYGTSPNPLTHWPRLSQPQAGGHRENRINNGTEDNKKEMSTTLRNINGAWGLGLVRPPTRDSAAERCRT